MTPPPLSRSSSPSPTTMRQRRARQELGDRDEIADAGTEPEIRTTSDSTTKIHTSQPTSAPTWLWTTVPTATPIRAQAEGEQLPRRRVASVCPPRCGDSRRDGEPRERDGGRHEQRSDGEPDPMIVVAIELRQEDADAMRRREKRGHDRAVTELGRDDRDPEDDREQDAEAEVSASLSDRGASLACVDRARAHQPGDRDGGEQNAPEQQDVRPAERRAHLEQLGRERARHARRLPAGQLEEDLLERLRLGDELVQDDSVGRSDLADCARRHHRPRAPSPTTATSMRVARESSSQAAARPGSAPASPPRAPAQRPPPTGACLISLPRWTITTSSADCATSASTWLETSTVRPSPASERRKSRASGCPAGRARSRARRGRAPRGSPSSAPASAEPLAHPERVAPSRAGSRRRSARRARAPHPRAWRQTGGRRAAHAQVVAPRAPRVEARCLEDRADRADGPSSSGTAGPGSSRCRRPGATSPSSAQTSSSSRPRSARGSR